MSRVGKKPIPLPKGVKMQIGEQLQVEGPKGKLSVPIPKGVRVEQTDGNLNVVRDGDEIRRAARFDPRAGRQRDPGRVDRVHAGTGHRRHRIPRRREGNASRLSHSAIRTRSRCFCPREWI